jgi:hypothetical protein
MVCDLTAVEEDESEERPRPERCRAANHLYTTLTDAARPRFDQLCRAGPCFSSDAFRERYVR